MFPAGGEVAVAAEEGAGLLRRHHRLLTSAVGAVRVGALRGEEAPLPCEDEEGADKPWALAMIELKKIVDFLEVFTFLNQNFLDCYIVCSSVGCT